MMLEEQEKWDNSEALIRERLEAMKVPYDVHAPKRLLQYHELLAQWNQRMNLTGNADFDVMLNQHYTDSVAPLQRDGLFPEGASIIDVGSGAGLPGLPLAIVRPDLQMVLLDSLAKRVHFLSEVIETLGLGNVRAIHARAEDAAHQPQWREAFHIAVARAVAPLPVLCELLLPFVEVGGKMLCYKGPAAIDEKEAGDAAAKLLGGAGIEWLPVELPHQPEWEHVVAVSAKEAPMPVKYPRKAGVPSRQPLG